MSTPPNWSPAPEPPDSGGSTQPAPAPVGAYDAPQYGHSPIAAEPSPNPYGVPAAGAIPSFPQYGNEYGYGPPTSPQPNNGLAIASLLTSLVSLLTVFPAPVGLILGIAALRAIRRDGTGGRGLAIAGIIIGATVTLGAAAIIGFFFVVATVMTVPGIEGAST